MTLIESLQKVGKKVSPVVYTKVHLIIKVFVTPRYVFLKAMGIYKMTGHKKTVYKTNFLNEIGVYFKFGAKIGHFSV